MSKARASGLALAVGMLLAADAAWGREFDVSVLTDTNGVCRNPSLSDGGRAVWTQIAGIDGDTVELRSDLWVCDPDGQPRNLTGERGEFSGRAEAPVAWGGNVYFLGWYREEAEEGPDFDLAAPPLTDEMKGMEEEYPSLFGRPDEYDSVEKAEGTETGEGGDAGEAAPEGEEGETKRKDTRKVNGSSLVRWDGAEFTRLTPKGLEMFAPSAGEGGVAVLASRMWPYGYDLLVWSEEKGLVQLTTNYFYVQGPRVQGGKAVWQEWDGNDYEIWMYDFATGEKEQLTNNTFDDTEPDLWGGVAVWVAYPVATGEIFLWQDGTIKKISDQSAENSHPRTWDGRAVWQGYDEDSKQFEVYYYDGKKTIKLTSNIWDDLSPVIGDGIVAWIGYVDLGDAEVMALDLGDNLPVQLTNDGEEERSLCIGGGRLLWQTDTGKASYLRMAVPRPVEGGPAGDE